MPLVYLDADACPVRDEATKVIIRRGLTLFIVSNGGIRPNPHPLVQNIIVGEGPDMVDLWIIDNIKKNDIVVTADLPLAKACLAKNARTILPTGDRLNSNNIDNLLATRNLMADLRSEDPLFQNRLKPFSKANRSKFLNSLELEIRLSLLG